MLQKFLFVGVGGSGGATVRMVRSMLSDRLEEVGYTDGIPAAWQFVHIDVPHEQGRHPEDVPVLSQSDYVGLADTGLNYWNLDNLLSGYGDDVAQHAAGWRPDPAQVHVDPTVGGGRFRAVGRVVMGARMAVAREGLRTALQALSGERNNQEFSRVCLALTGDGRLGDQPPQTVVVTSLAGGSGAGFVADVCDLLRQLQPSAKDRLTAILYSPDVFEDLAPMDRVGTNPNALAALSELLNGYWNTARRAHPDEFPFLRAAGALVDGEIKRRGPRIMYVIGRSNGEVSFSSQTDVYRAVARGLEMWATSPQLQDRFRQHELGNWSDRAQSRPDHSGLCDAHRERPLSSFGCASVGIGLDRFARYSVERLARAAADHLLRGHWPARDRQRVTEEAARERHAKDATTRFLVACELWDGKPDDAPIPNALRGGISASEFRQRAASQLRDQLLAQVIEHSPKAGLAVDTIINRVVARMDERSKDDLAGYRERIAQDARQWSDEINAGVANHAADLIAVEGTRVAYEVIDSAIKALTGPMAQSDPMVRRLEAYRDEQTQTRKAMRRNVKAALEGSPGPLPTSNPRIRQAVDAALDSFAAAIEELVADLSANLVRDLAENLLTPLRDAIGQASEKLAVQERGTPVRPSPVRDWPTGDGIVPARYAPARNELLLEPTSAYPDLFTSQIRAQVGDDAFDNAFTRARHEVITGAREPKPEDRVIGATGRWVPGDPRLGGQGATASFDVRVTVEQLLGRARRWIRRSDSSMGDYLSQSLGEYLKPQGADEHAEAGRLEEFRSLLAQAVAMSRPLVSIDGPTDVRVHGARRTSFREELTPLPFPPGHPGREAVRKVFASYSDERLEQLFGTERRERVDVFTFLDAPVQPIVMGSLTRPIKAQWIQDRTQPGLGSFWTWRRARQLPWFVPCTPEIRKDIVRGWMVARFLGQIRCERGQRLSPTEVWRGGHGYLSFPFPLLGRPLRSVDEWLPAVLESLVLTLIGEPFEPYGRLVSLGRSTVAADGISEEGELVRWIRTGQAAEDAPVPEPAIAGPADGCPEERSRALCKTLAEFEAHYEQYRHMKIDWTSGLSVSRAWEIRDDIFDALAEIHDVVRAASIGSFGNGYGVG